MIYLNYFKFPRDDVEFDYLLKVQRTCYDSFYPFKVISKHGLERIDF